MLKKMERKIISVYCKRILKCNKNNIKEIRKQILNKYNLRIGKRIRYDLLNTIYQEYVELFDKKTFYLTYI